MSSYRRMGTLFLLLLLLLVSSPVDLVKKGAPTSTTKSRGRSKPPDSRTEAGTGGRRLLNLFLSQCHGRRMQQQKQQLVFVDDEGRKGKKEMDPIFVFLEHNDNEDTHTHGFALVTPKVQTTLLYSCMQCPSNIILTYLTFWMMDDFSFFFFFVRRRRLHATYTVQHPSNFIVF